MSEATQHYKAGLALFGEGRNAEAIAEYRLALEAQPDWADCLHALATAQMNAGMLDDAIETSKRVTELHPEDPLAYTGLSMAYMRKGSIELAEQAQAQARMLSWKQDLAENPDAPPPA
jgi:Flp pilus assembly protein TadD